MLESDGNNRPIQAFPLMKGMVNLTTGVVNNVSIAHCVEDGDIIITWDDDTTDTISCIIGDDYTFTNIISVEVDSGTFHFSV